MVKKKNNIGKIIRDARMGSHMTIEDLADQIDVSSRYMTKIENEGNIPSYTVLKKLVCLLGIDANELFYDNYKIENYTVSFIKKKLSDCDERDLEVMKATLIALLKK